MWLNKKEVNAYWYRWNGFLPGHERIPFSNQLKIYIGSSCAWKPSSASKYALCSCTLTPFVPHQRKTNWHFQATINVFLHLLKQPQSRLNYPHKVLVVCTTVGTDLSNHWSHKKTFVLTRRKTNFCTNSSTAASVARISVAPDYIPLSALNPKVVHDTNRCLLKSTELWW